MDATTGLSTVLCNRPVLHIERLELTTLCNLVFRRTSMFGQKAHLTLAQGWL
jgi:hypothetical protein